MYTWQLDDAKNKLSSLVDAAMNGKPQCITRRGKDSVIVISIKEYERLKRQKKDLKDYLLESPKYNDGLSIKRVHGKVRKIEL